MSYYEENKNALHILQTEIWQEEYHGINTVFKPIPFKQEGMGLDPQILAAHQNDEQMKVFKALEDKYGGMPPAHVMREHEIDGTKDVTTTDILIEEKAVPESGMPVLVYRNKEEKGSRPAVVFIHGGAFTGGSMGQVNYFCKLLVELHDVVAVNVEYRLAPENPYPAGFEDCWAALRWVHANAESLGIDPKKIIISGDSAGGNMSASCCQKDRDEGTGIIAAQVLLYPAVLVGKAETEDFSWSIDLYDFEEDRPAAEGFARALEFSDQFLPFVYMNRPAPITDPYASPLFGSAEGLPPALVMTSEYDYLRPQAEAYVRKLHRAGVDAKYILYKGCVHATISLLGTVPQAYDIAVEYGPMIQSLK
ncbi:MAG: alpha/beta hydrolase [Ruminococcaceae bacterium]|nr:alpha/beta hydrolase [Oscillospiraceae bacterium]